MPSPATSPAAQRAFAETIALFGARRAVDCRNVGFVYLLPLVLEALARSDNRAIRLEAARLADKLAGKASPPPVRP